MPRAMPSDLSLLQASQMTTCCISSRVGQRAPALGGLQGSIIAVQYMNQSTVCWPADTVHVCAGDCHTPHPQQQPLVAMRGSCLEHANHGAALHEDCASCFCSGAAMRDLCLRRASQAAALHEDCASCL